MMRHHCDAFPLRLVDAVVPIVMLRGFKARSCDGRSGRVKLWRGPRRRTDMVEGYRLARPERPVPTLRADSCCRMNQDDGKRDSGKRIVSKPLPSRAPSDRLSGIMLGHLARARGTTLF